MKIRIVYGDESSGERQVVQEAISSFSLFIRRIVNLHFSTSIIFQAETSKHSELANKSNNDVQTKRTPPRARSPYRGQRLLQSKIRSQVAIRRSTVVEAFALLLDAIQGN